MGNCLFLRARGWGIDRQVRTELQIPGGVPGGGMVTGRIEPCINGVTERSRLSYPILMSRICRICFFTSKNSRPGSGHEILS